MSGPVEAFQIPIEAAELYEARFVPAIFGEWAPYLVEAAGVAPGQSVLDVACGTGVVAREAAKRVGENGKVVGVDRNPAMLTATPLCWPWPGACDPISSGERRTQRNSRSPTIPSMSCCARRR